MCILTGGFPCQDLSTANSKSTGLVRERSSLFHKIIRLIDVFPEVQHVILANVPRLLSMGFDVIKNELERLSFEVKSSIVSARMLGLYHNKKRLFIVASRSFSHLKKHSVNLSHEFNWDLVNVPRLIRCTDTSVRKNPRKRCGAIGNAIVTFRATKAFKLLGIQRKDRG